MCNSVGMCVQVHVHMGTFVCGDQRLTSYVVLQVSPTIVFEIESSFCLELTWFHGQGTPNIYLLLPLQQWDYNHVLTCPILKTMTSKDQI